MRCSLVSFLIVRVRCFVVKVMCWIRCMNGMITFAGNLHLTVYIHMPIANYGSV